MIRSMRPRAFAPAFILTAIATLPAVADVAIPNDFEADAPAKAADVNANFSAVATAINENAASIRSLSAAAAGTAVDVQTLRDLVDELSPAIRVAVGDVIVGRLLGFVPGGYMTVPISDPPFLQNEVTPVVGAMWSPIVEILTPMGYVVPIVTNTSSSPAWAPLPVEGDAAPLPIFFDQPGCVGSAFVIAPSAQSSGYFARGPAVSPWAYRNGFVFGSPDPHSPIRTYYVPANSLTTAHLASLLARKIAPPLAADAQPPPTDLVEGTTCVSLNGAESSNVAPALPNEPAVTGYSAVTGPVSLVY